jgi:predicted nucleic acid-binding protein
VDIKMKVYLDLCVYNRPFDDQTQPRIMMETLGVIIIMALVSSDEIKTINSFALEYENVKNPKLESKMIVSDMLQLASQFVKYSESIQKQAENLEAAGMMGIDSLHLACADHVDADFFITCDDNLIKRARRTGKINAKVISILEFIFKEVFNNETND